VPVAVCEIDQRFVIQTRMACEDAHDSVCFRHRHCIIADIFLMALRQRSFSANLWRPRSLHADSYTAGGASGVEMRRSDEGATQEAGGEEGHNKEFV
jgi:hypothetical protein